MKNVPDDREMPEEEQDLAEILKIRRSKLKELQQSGSDPFEITVFGRDTSCAEVSERFEELEGKEATVAGRLMSRRDMGKANFIDVRDSTGRLQVYVRVNDVGEEAFAAFKKWDIGDMIGVKGMVFRTRRGEITLHAHEVTLLAKSLLPLPEKWHGLRDTELRYRQRYLDLIVNPEVKDTFVKRSRIVSCIRSFLDERSFLEVETPVLNTIAGGAAARPFITHHNALDIDLYLRIATELYLKRLIIGGMERVYEIGKDFRNEGIDTNHNPEFTMLELYQAYTDYNGMMELTENLFSQTAKKVLGTDVVNYQGEEIRLTPPWKRMTMAEAVLQYAAVDFMSFKGDNEKARVAAKEAGFEFAADASWGDLLNLFFEEKVESQLVQPTFILDYPVEVSPLTKRKPGVPELTERFEFFISRREMGNAYSELNDPVDQRERFVRQAKLRASGDEEAQMMDEDFLTAMEYGMPPTGGLGIGIDRLVMLLTDSASIRDVLLFPTMKPKE